MDASNRWSQDLAGTTSSAVRGPQAGLVSGESVVDSSMAILRPAGDLDMLTCPAFRAWLHAELGHARHVTVDLTEVTFVASSALQVLLEAHELALSRGGDLRITGAGRRQLLRPFEITGLDRILTISASPAEPLATIGVCSGGLPRSDRTSATAGVHRGGRPADSGEDVA
jgi:anti-anti-sigma factor